MWCNVEKPNEWFILFLKFAALWALLYNMEKINEGFIKAVDDIKYWRSMSNTFEDWSLQCEYIFSKWNALT